jgi:uridine kinase
MKMLFENWRKFLKEQEEEPTTKPKAIFMAGGPGSGKSTVLKNLGLKQKIPNVINADDKYEADLKAVGLTLNGKPAAVSNYTSLKNELETLDPTADPAAYKEKEVEMLKAKEPVSQYARIFNKAQASKKADFKKYAKETVSFVVDGTGGDYNLMAKDKSDLKALGYDVAMIYVDLNVDICKQRNIERGKTGRQLLDKEVESSCAAVAKNHKTYKNLFKPNFFYVNSEEGKMDSSIAAIQSGVDAFIGAITENDYPLSAATVNKQINRIIKPTKKKNAKTKLPGWHRAKSNYLGSAPPGAGGS